MALKDWIQKTENKEDPPAIMANLAIIPERKPENSHNSHNSHRESPKMKQSNQVYNSEIQAAIRELDSREISIMDYPEATRHRAFMLEQKLTEARDQDDRSEFTKLLMEWKNCFH